MLSYHEKTESILTWNVSQNLDLEEFQMNEGGSFQRNCGAASVGK